MMKTLKIMLLLFVLAIGSNAQAQTKEETISWLKEKLNKSTKRIYLSDKAGRSVTGVGYEDKIIFDIKDNQLIVDFTYYNYYKEAFSMKVIVDLDKATITSNSAEPKIFGVFIDSEDYLPVKVISTKDVYIENGLRNSLTIQLKIEEEDLPQRIEKALKHYITIMPKAQKKTETF